MKGTSVLRRRLRLQFVTVVIFPPLSVRFAHPDNKESGPPRKKACDFIRTIRLSNVEGARRPAVDGYHGGKHRPLTTGLRLQGLGSWISIG